ncbi:MAG TPA: hypothetical protein VK735_18860 [Pseudonocardia sp.]|uniref:hypothetical protein n=1 Tax=Pseudonocardia sp. TaxID=60912 RepID=UPI002C83D107|nr:hypothetical protein [Pseudonocardia sp.]HTF49509.1 hypothetical protein [Pseudonocardia sp.]
MSRGKWRPTWASLNEKTRRGYVPLGTTKSGVREFVEHDCRPPSGSGTWTCGCGREWRT